MKYISYVLIILAICLTVNAYTTTEITAPPSTFDTQTSTSVNVSGGINASAFAGMYGNLTNINATVIVATTSAEAYTVNDWSMTTPGNDSFSIFWNLTVTLAEGYNWIKINFTWTNHSDEDYIIAGSSATAARIINVDTDLYLLNIGGFGAINFTLDTGNISTRGSLYVDGCILYNCSSAGGCAQLGVCT